MNLLKYYIIILPAAFFVFSYSVICAAESYLRDGAYPGKHSFVTVNVTVENGKILEIEIVEHGGGGEKYAAMVEPLLSEIIEKQSTDIDNITGATVSSENLKEAVNDALEKAASPDPVYKKKREAENAKRKDRRAED